MAYEFVDDTPAFEFEDSPSTAERIAANPLTRFAMAAGAPVLGALEWLPKQLGGEAIAENNRILRQMIARGESDLPSSLKALGTAADIGGSVLSPAFLKLAKALPAATSIKGLLGQGALVGGVGGATTTTGSAELADKLIPTALGVGVGGVLTPAAAGLTRGLGNILAPAASTQAAERGFAKVLSKAAKQEAPEVADILASQQPGKSLETMAQVTAGFRRPELAALQREVATFDPTAHLRNLEAQELLRKASVSKLNRESELVKAPIAERMNAVNAALVNLPKKAAQARGSAAQSVDDVRRLQRATDIARGYDIAGIPTLGAGQRPVIGTGLTQASGLVGRGERAIQDAAEESMRQGATARVAENLVGSFEARGLKPLTVDTFLPKLESVMEKTGNRSNKPLRLAIRDLTQRLQRAANPDGTIPLEEIHTLRKTGINEIIETIAKQRDPKISKQAIESEFIGLKSTLDDLVESAGGKGWKQYLADYSAARRKIEAPLEKLDAMKEIERLGASEARRLLGGEFAWSNVNLLNPVVSATNALMRALEGQAGQNVSRAGARLTLPENTQRLGQLMQQYQANPYGLLGDVVRMQGGAISPVIPYSETQMRGFLD